MSAMSLAKQAYSAFNREKPHSSITEWVEILTSRSYNDEAYDGIPEIVDSINIQETGPTEASRAIRKKLKHGDSHQQYRALVILQAIVENGGHKFQTSFANAQLTDAIKSLVHEPTSDPKVKKKTLAVLLSWHRQFKDDPSMSLVANLYQQCKPAESRPRVEQYSERGMDHVDYLEKKRQEEREKREKKEEEKRKAKEAKEAEKARTRREEEEKRRKASTQSKTKRKPASQASNNLVNAITLVNTEHDSLQENARVQECLEHAKVVRKQVVRYIQLVENEDMIGTLIETNERIIAALDTYDKAARVTEQDVEDVQKELAAVNIRDSELGKLQEKQRAAVQRSIGRSSSLNAYHDGEVHPDLQDLSFGALGAEQRNLPPPMRPTTSRYSSDEDNRHGSLSDYSDYESSDEETHNRASTSGAHQGRKPYVTVSDDEFDSRRDPKRSIPEEEDPFADPFQD
ncbi:putative actin patch assembly and actin polymerization protein [Steccherinum ochraceum]|uniref:Putative actin patch assembly and actin polymerization protein n=1 Tax=Steccherinum ochraceum TaxID=92696 RepID=A0A4R0RPL9_9APHY|nr:putative actin patch assembly and actin polymerization protein [Steccherinum ochraceum]